MDPLPSDTVARLKSDPTAALAAAGKWTVVDPDLLEVPAPRPAGWFEPLSANRKARHAADGRVSAMAMAAS